MGVAAQLIDEITLCRHLTHAVLIVVECTSPDYDAFLYRIGDVKKLVDGGGDGVNVGI